VRNPVAGEQSVSPYFSLPVFVSRSKLEKYNVQHPSISLLVLQPELTQRHSVGGEES